MPGWHISSGGGGGGGGTGDVVGPAGAVANDLVAFDGATGKLVKDTGILYTSVAVGPAAALDGQVAVFDGITGKLLKVTAATFTVAGTLSVPAAQRIGWDASPSFDQLSGTVIRVRNALNNGPTDFEAQNVSSYSTTNRLMLLWGSGTPPRLGMASGVKLAWTASATSSTDAPDLIAERIAAGQLAVNNATNGMANNIKIATTTVNAAGATSQAANLVPAGCILLGVTTRVTALITSGDGGTDVNIGNGTDADMYGATIAFAAGTTTNLASHTASALAFIPTAQNVVFTCNGGTFSGGTWRVCAHYLDLTAPTS